MVANLALNILTNYFTPNVGLVQQDLRHYTAQKDTLVSRLRLFSSR